MDLKSVYMGIAFALMWASAFTSARIIVIDAAPLAVSAVRFLFAGLVAITIAYLRGQTWRLGSEQWRSILVFGICQNAIYLGLVFVALKTVDASLVSIVASTMPLMVGFAGWAIFREPLAPISLAGLIVGVLGVCLIMASRMTNGVDGLGIALCVIAAVALGVATMSMKTAMSGGNLMMVVGLQMLVGAGILGLVAIFFEDVYFSPTLPSLVAFIYTVFVPGLLATVLWFRLVERIGPVRAATYHFLNPVFGVGIAALVLGERLERTDAIGVLIVGASILAVQYQKKPLKEGPLV